MTEALTGIGKNEACTDAGRRLVETQQWIGSKCTRNTIVAPVKRSELRTYARIRGRWLKAVERDGKIIVTIREKGE